MDGLMGLNGRLCQRRPMENKHTHKYVSESLNRGADTTKNGKCGTEKKENESNFV